MKTLMTHEKKLIEKKEGSEEKVERKQFKTSLGTQ